MNKFNIGDVVQSNDDKEFAVAGIRLYKDEIMYFSDEAGTMGYKESDLVLVQLYESDLTAQSLIDMTNDFLRASREASEKLAAAWGNPISSVSGVACKTPSVSWGDITPTVVPTITKISTDNVMHRRMVTKDELESLYSLASQPEKHKGITTGAEAMRILQQQAHSAYLEKLCADMHNLIPSGVKLLKMSQFETKLEELFPSQFKQECKHDYAEQKIFSNFSTYKCRLCGESK